MDEIEAVERMRLVLEAAIHGGAADAAGMALNRGGSIDDLELVAVFQLLHIVARNDSNHGEGGAFGFPAFGAAAGVVMRDVAGDGDLDRPVLAFADQGSAGESSGTFLDAVVNRRVDANGHGSILLVFDVSDYER